jgi:hypothetical protein
MQTLFFYVSPHFASIGAYWSIFMYSLSGFCTNSAFSHYCPIFIGEFCILSAGGGRLYGSVVNPFIVVVHFACNNATVATDALC